MSDAIVREAERRFVCGEISEEDYNTIRVRFGLRPLKPKYDYQEFAHNDNTEDYLGRALPALEAFLKAPAVILASDAVGDYQGIYYAILAVVNGPLYDGDVTFAMWSDYYGSCGGCDSYEDAPISEQFDMIKGTLRNITQFWSLDDMKEFWETERNGAEYYDYHGFPMELIETARNKLEQLKEGTK